MEVVRPGPFATVQDLGRTGYAHLGVSPSGAADARSHRLANRLVGNAETAAGLELLLGDAELRFHRATTVAVTGAPAPLRLDGWPMPLCEPWRVLAGQTLRIGTPGCGLRVYLAVAGGVDVPSTMDSRATDTLSGLGPTPLRTGDRLPVGIPSHSPAATHLAACMMARPVEPVVRVMRGPRDDFFDTDAFATLVVSRWLVTSDANRVGVRLTGPPLRHAGEAQLPSEGMVRGAIQVPSSGQPIVFLADHPTTGGYPVIAVVARDDIPLLAQARPGVGVRFEEHRGDRS
ncbi:biotin-dependent carboxyltransferase family protein [Lentzea sp. PSKA42]|uniref:Biotin-dependent carboxyltransferase family protein n=1 Tax=Lentzea indica TaxID=2604800 RepID=A0ABX1FHE2_9PSEU|nr:biotin-dependent carboxyltransferase family protein [Lentzea indica]